MNSGLLHQHLSVFMFFLNRFHGVGDGVAISEFLLLGFVLLNFVLHWTFCVREEGSSVAVYIVQLLYLALDGNQEGKYPANAGAYGACPAISARWLEAGGFSELLVNFGMRCVKEQQGGRGILPSCQSCFWFISKLWSMCAQDVLNDRCKPLIDERVGLREQYV